jgi:hypothetical protein
MILTWNMNSKWLKLLKPLKWIPYLTHKALMVGHLKLGELVVKFNYHYVFSIKVESGPFPWLFRVGNTLTCLPIFSH